MSEGYTYTTISADPGQPGRIAVSFYLDDRARISVYGQECGRLHLGVSLGDVSVSIAPAPGAATEQDAQIARDLATAAAKYAAAVERLARLSRPDTTAA
jgi:hypothetical protein